jgi:hypothetical protein
MRIASLVAVFVLACGLASAARQEPFTYVEGNLTGVIPNSGGSLTLSESQALELKTGLATVSVPYAGITKAELGATREHSEKEPLYKVWALPKRLWGGSMTQLVKIEFKGEDGEPKTMTLELDKSSAPEVVEHLRRQNPSLPGAAAVAASPADWWGDRYWKTARNADKWQKPAPKASE